MVGPEFPIFPFPDDDPLAAEHILVSLWVREATASLPAERYYEDVQLKDLPSGRELLATSPDRSRLLLQAAVAQAKFWNAAAKKLAENRPRDGQATNIAMIPGWSFARGAGKKTITVVAALLRRSLPLERVDVIQILEWLAEPGSYGLPLG